ncbi:c-type cytochrome [Gaetbulibacter sp. M235]|uniref:c-type cytochrome n=1 Tax=Gaetbulibacter sp. M235 TaxID=3126510 RepID=UPI00374F093E
MKNNIFKLVTAITVLIILGCNNSNNEKKDYQNNATLQDQITRGKYLVNTIGCNDCHSPKIMTEKGPIPDPNRLLSGHDSNEALPPFNPETIKGYVLFNMNSTAVVGPWGTSFAANLTPDATGIGSWSDEQFLRAMKQGKYKGLENSRQLLPPMPWPSYSQMPDEDIKAIFTYLKSIKPVENIVPQPIEPHKSKV